MSFSRRAMSTGPRSVAARRAHMRMVVVERLTRSVFDRHQKLIAGAHALWAHRTPALEVARLAVEDDRWRIGDVALLGRADHDLGVWAYELAQLQSQVSPLTRIDRAILVHGLHGRLAAAARAQAIVGRLLAEEGDPRGGATLDVIASDPYIRAGFGPDWSGRTAVSVNLHSDPATPAAVVDVRERASASGSVRALQLASVSRLKAVRPVRRARTVGFFVPDQGFFEYFIPIRAELHRRGWRVVIFAYRTLAGSDRDVIPFREAVRPIGYRAPSRFRRQWAIDPDTLRTSPVPPAAVRRALDSTWATAKFQTELHLSVLEGWRPDVVVSFGPDTMSLALHAATSTSGTPSVFLPHGFLDPSPLNWSLTATATPVAGRACAEVNAVNPFGEHQAGLVPVGHPNFDDIVRTTARPSSDPTIALSIPSSRPFVVLLFAGWGRDLLDLTMFRRMTSMAAAALPDDAFLICKLHPGEHEQREVYEDVLAADLARDAFLVVSGKEVGTPDLLRRSDVVVTIEDSMTAADAVVAGVPTVVVRSPLHPAGARGLAHPGKDYAMVCAVVTTVDELRAELIRLTRDRVARAHVLRRRGEYIGRFLFAADGRSSARTVELIEALAAGRDPDTFTPSC